MKVLKTALLITTALLIAGGVKLIKSKKEAKEAPPTLYPIKVKTYTPEYTHITLTLPATAEVKNSKEVKISSKFAGKIMYIKNLGERVKKGDIVLKIDPTPLKTQLHTLNLKTASLKEKIKAEEINLQNLLNTHKRTKKLLDVKMASIEQYQTESSKIAQLKASIKSDKNSLKSLYYQKKSILNDLKYTSIRSSVSGVVSAKMFNKGDIAPLLKPVLKITPKGGNYLLVLLPKKESAIIYKNRKYPLIPLNTAINGLKAYKAKTDDNSLSPGERVNIRVVTFDANATFLPFNTILTIDNQNYIFTPKSKKINILAEGSKGVAVKKITTPIIQAQPDILLKIKAGYPVEIKE